MKRIDVVEVFLRKDVRQKLTRSNLRDIALLVAVISVPFCRINDGRMVVAFAFLAAGCTLHLVTKGTLVRNVVLCDKGIYSVIRHPYYLANFLVDISFCLLSGNIYLLLAYPFLFFWAYGPTMRKEETYLSSCHPEAFAQHGATVPQIFPERVSFVQWKTVFKWFTPERISWKESARVTKFCAAGLFIAFLHEIKTDGVIVLKDVLSRTGQDLDEYILGIIAGIFYIASTGFMTKAKLSTGKEAACR